MTPDQLSKINGSRLALYGSDYPLSNTISPLDINKLKKQFNPNITQTELLPIKRTNETDYNAIINGTYHKKDEQ